MSPLQLAYLRADSDCGKLCEMAINQFIAAQSRSHSNSWLTHLQLRVNPFTYLDAAEDPELLNYLVADETSRIVVTGIPALMFAPSGGGKTALRVSAFRTCWSNARSYMHFPVQYVLDRRFDPSNSSPTLSQHRDKLIEAITADLFLGLAFRPELFLALSHNEQRTLADAVMSELGMPLRYCLALLQEFGLQAVNRLLGSGYLFVPESSATSIAEYCAAFYSAIQPGKSTLRMPLVDLCQCITTILPFKRVLCLVDGLDGFPNTHSNSQNAAAWLDGFLRLWADELGPHVRLQAYLPEDTRGHIETHPAVLQARLKVVSLNNWSHEQLVALLRRRVTVASGGEFDSLDAVAGPDVESIEDQIVHAAAPLPREVILLAKCLLEIYAERVSVDPVWLCRRDLTLAIERYRAETRILPESAKV